MNPKPDNKMISRKLLLRTIVGAMILCAGLIVVFILMVPSLNRAQVVLFQGNSGYSPAPQQLYVANKQLNDVHSLYRWWPVGGVQYVASLIGMGFGLYAARTSLRPKSIFVAFGVTFAAFLTGEFISQMLFWSNYFRQWNEEWFVWHEMFPGSHLLYTAETLPVALLVAAVTAMLVNCFYRKPVRS